LTYPVPNSMISHNSAPAPWTNDGTPCQRMRVELRMSNSTSFAKILGVDDVPVTRSATVKGTTGAARRVPALWLLDPTGCVPLSVGGGSQLTVGLTSPTIVPGLIAVDSSGSSCSSNQYTISVSGTGTRLVAVPQTGDTPGQIMTHALPAGATTCVAPACNPADVSGGRLSPQPQRANNRATRAPVDWRYNCKTSYPNYFGIPINGCTTGIPAYIDNLTSAIGTTGQPAGFQRWSTTYGCNVSGQIVATGNWWVDCTGPSGLSISNGNSVSFSGGNVIFQNGLSMGNGAGLSFNGANPSASLPAACLPPTVTTPCLTSSSSNAAWVFLRNGDIKITGGEFSVNRAAVIGPTSVLSVNSAPPTWRAPTEGPFAGLAFWSEANSSGFGMAGGAGVNLSGVFFTPGASPFSLTGGGSWGQQAAQFISYRLAVSGGGVATLAPDDTLVGLGVDGGQLIR
jgi:hypothetical protein